MRKYCTKLQDKKVADPKWVCRIDGPWNYGTDLTVKAGNGIDFDTVFELAKKGDF